MSCPMRIHAKSNHNFVMVSEIQPFPFTALKNKAKDNISQTKCLS